MKRSDLLKACLTALNQIPNRSIAHPVFKNTYELAAALGDTLRGSESELPKPKVLIEMDGGVIQRTAASCDTSILLIDWDCKESGQNPFRGVQSPDNIFVPGKSHLLFDKNDKWENRIISMLKQVKF